MVDRRASTIAAMERFSESQRPKQPSRKNNSHGAGSEYQEQIAVCDWLKLRGVEYFSVPNGAYYGAGQMSFKRGAMLRRAGVKAGVPDIILITRAIDGRPVALEMKREKGGSVSDEQRAWHETMRSCGWHVVIGKGAQDAINQLMGLLWP